ncbi:hypothetical protein QBC35DRAFT_374058 [Podospora australis]|uniref:SET domain-containing protein n=1 Tax=Podospora australis TaxID=1536484 RepID=A0AAN7AMN0_9PEZI|nr:hypothetical protein QBC35DRAFT_374058 [Podospora australis]
MISPPKFLSTKHWWWCGITSLTFLSQTIASTQEWTVCRWNPHDSLLFTRPTLGRGTCPLEYDFSPWVVSGHKPYCPQPGDGFESGLPDCVFTVPTFRGSQGISLITTPDLAASVADSALDDSTIAPGLRSHLSEDAVSHPPWEVRDLPGRGKGLVAKQKFRKHQTVMVGFPVLVVRLDFINGDRYKAKKRQAMLEQAVDQLPKEQQRAIFSLAKSSGGHPIIDILRTNGFGVEIDGVQHTALFTDGSRVNHNCRPNAFWRYISSAMAMEVVALRNIAPGEEVAHSYAPLGYTLEERKAVLRSWGFQCRCALCSAPERERQISDSRRERLLEIHQLLNKASELQGGYQRVDELVREALALVDQEELQPQLVEYYQQFAKAYMAIGDLQQAREFVKAADQMWNFYGGEEHENVEGMKELWNTLREAERELEDD